MSINARDLKGMVEMREKTKTVVVGGFEIEVLQYMPIMDKITLATSAVMSATNESGSIDQNSLEIAFKVLITKTYSSVELPKNNIDAYDLVVSTGVYNAIVGVIPRDEIEEVRRVLDNHSKEKQAEHIEKNTLESSIKNAIEDFKNIGYALVSKLPDESELSDIMLGAKDSLNEMNPENLKFITDFIKISDKTKEVD